jgi:hypothetical protein
VSKSILEEGDNYRVELDAGVAVCTVWSRPDLDFETGAQLAAQKVTLCRSLAAGPALGFLFDLREAPKVTGPKTQASLELIVGIWEAAARPIAIIVNPASMQKLQLTRIARDAGPRHAEVFIDFELAREWLQRRLPARRTEAQSARAESAPAGASLEAAATPKQPSSPARASSPRSDAAKRRS